MEVTAGQEAAHAHASWDESEALLQQLSVAMQQCKAAGGPPNNELIASLQSCLSLCQSGSGQPWARPRGGRLVRQSGPLPPAARTRRRRRSARPAAFRLLQLPEHVHAHIIHTLAPPDRADPRPLMRYAPTSRAFRELLRYGMQHMNVLAVPENDQLVLMELYARARAPLVSLTLRLGCEEGPAILNWLYEKCDMSGLKELDLRLYPEPLHTLTLHKLRLVTGNDPNRVIDVESDMMRHVIDPTVLLEFPGFVSWDTRPADWATKLPVTSYSQLSSLTHLRLGGDHECGFGELRGFTSLTHLTISVPPGGHDPTELETSIALLPRLRSLDLRSGHHQYFRLSSLSVEIVTCLHAGKGLFLTQVDCPRLITLEVRDALYGSGIRRLLPSSSDAERVFPQRYENELYVFETLTVDWQERPLQELVKNVPAAGNLWYAPYEHNLYDADKALPVSLPPSCTIRFAYESHTNGEQAPLVGMSHEHSMAMRSSQAREFDLH